MQDRFEVRMYEDHGPSMGMAYFRIAEHAYDYARRQSLDNAKLWLVLDTRNEIRSVYFRHGLQVEA